ncbi:MAG TPA: PepSY domain-containing protein [Ignavibacteria bacterium]|nr:PepSY domain-containing protein [Ignavibacteria bacterium]
MVTVKVILPVVLILLFCFKAEGKFDLNKYSKTSYNFLDTNTSNLLTIKDAVDYTSELLKCDIIKAEKKFRKDIPVWKVNVITEGRGSAVIEISAEEKALVSIDAGEGPFEYDITPDKNFISFSEAKRKAEEYSGQKTLKWKYVKNKNSWEYNFWMFIKSGKAQVRIDAASGEIVTVRKK